MGIRIQKAGRRLFPKDLMDMVYVVFGLLVFVSVPDIGRAVTLDQTASRVTVTGAAPIAGQNIQGAKTLAMQLAHRQAINHAVCKAISVESLTVHLRLSGNLAGSIPHCHIVNSRVLEGGADHTAPVPLYRLKIEAFVVEAESKADPAFQLKAQLNNTRFRQGEQMVVRVTPTMDCYCYIYIVLEDGRIMQLLPNNFKDHNFITADQTLIFPDAEKKTRTIVLKTYLPAGKDATIEWVYIVAVKQPAKLDLEAINPGGSSRHKENAIHFEELVSAVATIAGDARTESLLQYRIIK